MARSHYPEANFTCANLNALKEIIFQPQPKMDWTCRFSIRIVGKRLFVQSFSFAPGRLSHIIPFCNSNNNRRIAFPFYKILSEIRVNAFRMGMSDRKEWRKSLLTSISFLLLLMIILVVIHRISCGYYRVAPLILNWNNKFVRILIIIIIIIAVDLPYRKCLFRQLVIKALYPL